MVEQLKSLRKDIDDVNATLISVEIEAAEARKYNEESLDIITKSESISNEIDNKLRVL